MNTCSTSQPDLPNNEETSEVHTQFNGQVCVICKEKNEERLVKVSNKGWISLKELFEQQKNDVLSEELTFKKQNLIRRNPIPKSSFVNISRENIIPFRQDEYFSSVDNKIAFIEHLMLFLASKSIIGRSCSDDADCDIVKEAMNHASKNKKTVVCVCESRFFWSILAVLFFLSALGQRLWAGWLQILPEGFPRQGGRLPGETSEAVQPPRVLSKESMSFRGGSRAVNPVLQILTALAAEVAGTRKIFIKSVLGCPQTNIIARPESSHQSLVRPATQQVLPGLCQSSIYRFGTGLLDDVLGVLPARHALQEWEDDVWREASLPGANAEVSQGNAGQVRQTTRLTPAFGRLSEVPLAAFQPPRRDFLKCQSPWVVHRESQGFFPAS